MERLRARREVVFQDMTLILAVIVADLVRSC